MKKVIKYYVQGHTGKGYVNYIESNLQQINKIVLLQNDNPFIITAIINKLKNQFTDKSLEIIKSIESKHIVEGIIVRDESLAILNERMYQGTQKGLRRIKVSDRLLTMPSIDLKLNKNLEQKSYNHFSNGLSIHEKLEKIYIAEMDFTKADRIIEQLKEHLFSQVVKAKKQSVVYERLFGTNTPDGIVNEVENLMEPLSNKIYILGRAGTGKSYLMNKVLEQCVSFGIDVEVYRCSLDPNSIDMLIIRKLDLVIHDNTSPHVVPIATSSKRIIDMYKETVNERVESEHKNKIKKLKESYKNEMQTGIHYLQGQKLNLNIDKIKLNEEELDKIVKEIIK